MAFPFSPFEDSAQPAPSEGYVPSFLSKLPFYRRRKGGPVSSPYRPKPQQHTLEQLEPRVLLAADLSFGAATDLTLQYDGLASEYQLIDDSRVRSEKGKTGSFYDVLPPKPDRKPPRMGEWNTSRIVVQGEWVEHWLNGEQILRYQLSHAHLAFVDQLLHNQFLQLLPLFHLFENLHGFLFSLKMP